MIGSIYISMSGMNSFDKGLGNISSNVANMNTNGYKRSDLSFQNTLTNEFNQNSATEAKLMSTDFTQGELQASSSSTDMAINGLGYFILRDEGNTYYTRSGEFDFDADGFLVHKANGYRVAGLSGTSSLQDINIKDLRAIDSTPTTEIELVGNLSVSGTLHNITDVEVIDDDGNRRVLSLEFTNNSATTPQSWLIEVQDETGATIASGLEVRFNPNGSPMDGFNSVNFDLEADSGAITAINLSMGDPGSFNQVTHFSSGSTSSAEIDTVNGSSAGVMVGLEIDKSGNIVVNYSNGESRQASQMALAYFQGNDLLVGQDLGLFQSNGSENPIIGAVDEGGLGIIEGGKIELSNVELTSEFTDMIIIQRGYQASSQILTSANEMIQQLMEATSK